MNYAVEKFEHNATATAHLVDIVQELSFCRSLDAILEVVRTAARDLTGTDGAAFVLKDGNLCHHVTENASFSPEDLALLEALANVASVAMENIARYAKLQEQIKALETSNGELKRFATIVSNDLKSPLKAIDNLSGWIAEGLHEQRYEESQEHLKVLRARIGRMEKFLDDVQEYAAVDSAGSRPPTEMWYGIDILEALIRNLDIPKSFRIETRGDFNDLAMPRMPLQQIFCNLVRNAIQHHHMDSGVVTIDVETGDEFHTFQVSDDGPGIPLSCRQRIIEIFRSSQPDETMKEKEWLGLRLVKRILDAYGGDISLQCHAGRGSTFFFTWPVQAR